MELSYQSDPEIMEDALQAWIKIGPTLPASLGDMQHGVPEE